MKKTLLRFLLYKLRVCVLYYKYKSYKISKSFPRKRNLHTSQKGVVYMADGKCNPGGLCDRLYGIISLYKISKWKKLPFYINFVEPFCLSDYLLPNVLDWRINRSSVDNQDNVLDVFCASEKYDYPLYKEAEIQRKFFINNIENNDALNKVYTNAHLVDNPIEFSKMFNELFVPSKPLSDAINRNITNINGHYIAVVLRFQNLLGDFIEGNIKPLEEQKQKCIINKLQSKIAEIHSQNTNYKVLVTSDSRKFLDSLKNIDYIYTIPGKVVHMSFTNDKSFNIHLKSFVDLYMVSMANKIFLLLTGDMYHSGFAKCASMIHNKPYYEVFF